MGTYPLASSTWGEEEIQAMHEVINSGNFTMGEKVAKFEDRFSQEVGAKHAVMFNSGSSANLALLTACRYRAGALLNPGDEVIVPAVSWSTTYYPVNQIGAILKFVDVDPQTLNIDIAKTEAAITSGTKAIFAVNLLGNPADWIALKSLAENKKVLLLEDNCESLGAKIEGKSAGTFGLGGTFSTFFSHHISTMEGGLAVTDDESLYQTMKSIRAHGWTRELPDENHVHSKTGNRWDDLYRFVLPGYNLRPLELEAAIGLVQIERVKRFVETRRANAEILFKNMAKIPNFRLQKENGTSSWFGFSIILEEKLKNRRTDLIKILDSAGIESRPIVTGNFTRNPVIKHLNHAEIGPLPGADEIHDSGLFVGNHHYDLTKEISHLCSVLDDFQRRF